MVEKPLLIGRVLRASTTSFALGCMQLISEQDELIPEFGALVKAYDARGNTIYGLIYNVAIEDDAFVRQLVAAGVNSPEVIEDHRRNRQVPIEVDVLVTGYAQGERLFHRLPPQPPGTLNEIFACNAAELVRFTQRNDWLRTALQTAEGPADALVAATLRAATAARPPDQRETYLIDAARELARLLALDLPRLDGILAQLRDR